MILSDLVVKTLTDLPTRPVSSLVLTVQVPNVVGVFYPQKKERKTMEQRQLHVFSYATARKKESNCPRRCRSCSLTKLINCRFSLYSDQHYPHPEQVSD